MKAGDRIKQGTEIGVITQLLNGDTVYALFPSRGTISLRTSQFELYETMNACIGQDIQIFDSTPGQPVHASGLSKTEFPGGKIVKIMSIRDSTSFNCSYDVGKSCWVFSSELRTLTGLTLYSPVTSTISGVKSMEAPNTELERKACDEAKQDAIKTVVAAKKMQYQQAMTNYISKETQRRTLDKECKELEEKLGISEEMKEQLF
jgi:hypothetical protein